MDIYPTSKDKISLLNRTSVRTSRDSTNPNTFRSSSYGPSTSKSSSQRDQFQDTVHYLSPVTTPARTEYEGDLFYQQFVDFQKDFIPQPTDYVASTKSSSSMSCEEPELQRTLAIIKPDAVKYKDVVLRVINESGLKIVNQRTLHLTPEQVSEIYSKHYGCPTFPHMVVSLSISPILVLSLAGKNCVNKWKTMVGPYSLLREEWFFPYSVRTRFGLMPDIPDVIHASENIPEAKWENRYFYPRSILEPILMEQDKVTDYITLHLKPTLLQGLIQLVRTKPVDPVCFLAEWLLLNNPYQPSFPENVAISPL